MRETKTVSRILKRFLYYWLVMGDKKYDILMQLCFSIGVFMCPTCQATQGFVNRLNRKEIICAVCRQSYPNGSFKEYVREDEEVIVIDSFGDGICQRFSVRNANVLCGGGIIFTHQGWVSNSRCEVCGQRYLNLRMRQSQQMEYSDSSIQRLVH